MKKERLIYREKGRIRLLENNKEIEIRNNKKMRSQLKKN